METECSSKLSSFGTLHSCLLEDKISRKLTLKEVSKTTHVIHGLQGVGKTKLAHSIATNEECRKFFPDGIVWIGIGFRKAIDYENLIVLYQAILSQINPVVADQPDFDSVLFVPSSGEKSEEDKEKERRAMWDARDIMSQKIGHKKILLCLDGLQEVGDVTLFHFNSGDKIAERKCRVLITASGRPNKSHEIKSWELKHLSEDESKRMLEVEIGSRESFFMFLNKFGDLLPLCKGVPALIRALGKLFNDQYRSENHQSLQCIADTINQLKNSRMDLKTRVFIVIEATVSNIMLDDEFSRIPWVCFEAFTNIFTREDCYRPLIPKAAVLTLFRAVISKILKSETDPGKLHQIVNKLVDKFVLMGMLSQIDGSNGHNKSQQFYQVQNDMYQDFGEKASSAGAKTRERLHQIFVEDSSIDLNGQVKADGSNDIDLYMVRWLPFHLIGANQVNETARALKSATFIRKRIRNMGARLAAKQHKVDSEKLLGSITKHYARESKFLTLAYRSFLEILEDEYADKENGAGCATNDIIQAIWTFSYSLFMNNFVNDGYEMLRIGRQNDGNAFIKCIGIDMNSIHPFCSVNCDDRLNSARALIKLGSTIALTKKKQEAIALLQTGLYELQDAVGGGICLEAARAHMFVGEIFYDLKLYVDALENFRIGLPVLREVLGENSEELFDALLLIAKAYFRVGDLDTSLGILKCIATKVRGSTAVSVLLKIGEILMLKRDFKKSISNLKAAKKETSSPYLLKRINDSIERVQSKSARLNGGTTTLVQ